MVEDFQMTPLKKYMKKDSYKDMHSVMKKGAYPVGDLGHGNDHYGHSYGLDQRHHDKNHGLKHHHISKEKEQGSLFILL